MKIQNYIILIAISILLISCNQPIALDDPNVQGTGPGAKAVIEKAEAALEGITSISAVMESTKDSEMYGFEKTYNGKLIIEFAGKPGSMGNRWFEAKQSMKGKDKHIKGVITKDGLKELHILKKKVIKGDATASSGTMIASAFSSVFGDETFFAG